MLINTLSPNYIGLHRCTTTQAILDEHLCNRHVLEPEAPRFVQPRHQHQRQSHLSIPPTPVLQQDPNPCIVDRYVIERCTRPWTCIRIRIRTYHTRAYGRIPRSKSILFQKKNRERNSSSFSPCSPIRRQAPSANAPCIEPSIIPWGSFSARQMPRSIHMREVAMFA